MSPDIGQELICYMLVWLCFSISPGVQQVASKSNFTLPPRASVLCGCDVQITVIGGIKPFTNRKGSYVFKCNWISGLRFTSGLV